MQELRKRYIRDLTNENSALNTIRNYVKSIEELAVFYNRCPSVLTEEELKDYLYHVRQRGCSWSKVNIVQSAMKRLYKETLKQPQKMESIKRPKWESKVKAIMSREEIVKLLEGCKNLKHKVIFMTMYACGLRVGELCGLKVSDIDSSRMVLQIRNAKGHREREVLLPDQLLFWLRVYILKNPSKDYVFRGIRAGKGISSNAVQTAFRRKIKEIGILKEVSTHTLRHTHTTHSLEEGSDLLAVKRNLGHRSIKTTLEYYHLTYRLSQTLISPLSTLPVYGKSDG